MKDTINVSKENYLKAVLEAEAEGRQVIPAVLAHWLEVSAPAVTMALKRLKRDGLVNVDSDGIVRLTPAGRETAYRTALRHHLIERMLSEIFGMDWHEIHEEAERLEHAVSPAFEAKLKEKLGEAEPAPTATPCFPKIPPTANAAARFRSLKPSKAAATPSPACTSAIPNSCSSSTAPESAPVRSSKSPARITTKPSRFSSLRESQSSAGRLRKPSGSALTVLPEREKLPVPSPLRGVQDNAV